MPLFFYDFSRIRFSETTGDTLPRRQRLRFEGLNGRDDGDEIVVTNTPLTGLQVTELATTTGLVDGEVRACNGYASAGDGGGGLFSWAAGVPAIAEDGFIRIDATGGQWERIVDGLPSVKWFGARGDGTTDDGPAFRAAQAFGGAFRVPAVATFYRIVGPLNNFTTGGMVGDDLHVGGSTVRSVLRFEACTSTTSGAINLRSGSGARIRLENLFIYANSWDAVTGCSGYGVDTETQTIARNVLVQGFQRSGWFFHQNMAGNSGPYGSLIENCESNANGHHGFLLGSGANSVTFLNPHAFHNGAPAYGTNPSFEGLYDGLYIADTADGAGYPGYFPEQLSVVGGDCSYNSRFGWNIDGLAHSQLQLGYAEGNLRKEVHVGRDIVRTSVYINQMFGGIAGFENGMNYASYYPGSAVYFGNKRVAPTHCYDFVASQDTDDDVDTGYGTASEQVVYMARSNDFAHFAYLRANTTPDGTPINKATESCLLVGGAGTYAMGFGNGGHHLKIEPNKVRLPTLFYVATTTGWSSPSRRVFFANAPPSGAPPDGGNWNVGDMAFNSEPTSGEPAGWFCTASGSPGTWNGYGTIS